MARTSKPEKKSIETYEHKDRQRLNNPPAGPVTPDTDRETSRRSYSYDPHLDPQLVWAGKAEHTSFWAPAVSLPFEPGPYERAAVKIIDDRGMESLRIMEAK